MHKRRLDHLLAGAAVTAVLALTASGNSAFAQSNQPVLASVPASEAPVSRPAAAAARHRAAARSRAAAGPPPPRRAAPAKETTGNVPVQDRLGRRSTPQIADKLRELSAGKFDRMFGGRKERAGIEAFYSERNFAPLWITNGAVNDARQGRGRLSRPRRRSTASSPATIRRPNSGPAPKPTRSRRPSSS